MKKENIFSWFKEELSFSAMIVSPDVWLSILTRKSPDDQRDKINLGIYGCLVGASFVFAILRAYGFLLVSLRCSERLHDRMVVAILQAPVLFFDSNPVGRILNRFSKDIGCVDELLPKTFLFSIQLVLLVIASIPACPSRDKSLASTRCCSRDCRSLVHLEVLLEDG